MRLTAVLALAVLVAMSASGCLLFRDCDIHQRKAIWTQDDVPLQPSGVSTEHEVDDLWGGITRRPETGELHLTVFKNGSVSHEELAHFAETLFAEKGWPPPQLEQARESESCGDHL